MQIGKKVKEKEGARERESERNNGCTKLECAAMIFYNDSGKAREPDLLMPVRVRKREEA